jgi:hypothetical protein
MRRATPKDWNGIPNREFLEERPEPKRHQSHKDTKHWCGGRPGREHILIWETMHSFEWKAPRGEIGKIVSITQIQKCFICGKHMQYRHKNFHVANGVWTVREGRRW